MSRPSEGDRPGGSEAALAATPKAFVGGRRCVSRLLGGMGAAACETRSGSCVTMGGSSAAAAAGTPTVTPAPTGWAARLTELLLQVVEHSPRRSQGGIGLERQREVLQCDPWLPLLIQQEAHVVIWPAAPCTERNCSNASASRPWSTSMAARLLRIAGCAAPIESPAARRKRPL